MQFNGVFLDAVGFNGLGILSHTIVDGMLDNPMKLPEKEHFSLNELAERWHAPLADMQYYAVHGMLEVQTWLDLPAVELYRLKKTEDGDRVPVSVGLDSYHDYVIVDPRDIRKVFRSEGKSPIAKYRPVSRADLIKTLVPTDGALVAANDLVVSRADRDRFERAHGIECGAERGAQSTSTDRRQLPPATPMSFPGRPSVMRRITDHFEERRKKKALEKSLQREGDYLVAWAEKQIPNVQIPTARTIRNVIRAHYRESVLA